MNERVCKYWAAICIVWRTIFEWMEEFSIDLHAVLVTTLYLTVDIIQWAQDFADMHPDLDAGKMTGAISSLTGPWALMQGAFLMFYVQGVQARMAAKAAAKKP